MNLEDRIHREVNENRLAMLRAMDQYCPVCGKKITSGRTIRTRYCSYRCCNDAKIERRRKRREDARQKTCGHCGLPFVASRSDAKFCSPACRQGNFRQNSAEPASVTVA